MDLWQLKIFCSVIDHQSFSKAAAAIHLSQPTVSNHIKELEQHFDCRLLDRFSRRAVPTKTGEVLYRHAVKLLALSREAELAVNQFQGKIKGRLQIGGSTIPGGYLLPPLIGRFKSAYPDVLISLRIADTGGIIDDVVTGSVEIGIVGAKSSLPEIAQDKLIDDKLILAVPADHRWSSRKRIRIDELRREPFIAREKGSGTLKSLELSLAAKDLDLNALHVVAEMGSSQALISGIKHGVGVSILSSLAVSEYLETGQIHALTVSGLNLKRGFYLTRHRRRTQSPLALVFCNFLVGPEATDHS